MDNKKTILDKIINLWKWKLSYQDNFKSNIKGLIIWTILCFIAFVSSEEKFTIIIFSIIYSSIYLIPIIYNYINWKRGK